MDDDEALEGLVGAKGGGYRGNEGGNHDGYDDDDDDGNNRGPGVSIGRRGTIRVIIRSRAFL